MRKFLLIVLSSLFLPCCTAELPKIAELKPGATFGDARRAAAAAAESYECMEMDHPEQRRMTMECIKRSEAQEHFCYSFVNKNGVFVLDNNSCEAGSR